MKINLLFVVSLFLLASFCEREEDPKKNLEFENETFILLHFKNEQQCLDAQPSDFFINCHSELTFLENNQVEIILTDIIWRGDYQIIKKNIILNFQNNPEIPEGTIVFQIINNSKLKKVDDKTIWNRKTGESIWD